MTLILRKFKSLKALIGLVCVFSATTAHAGYYLNKQLNLEQKEIETPPNTIEKKPVNSQKRQATCTPMLVTLKSILEEGKLEESAFDVKEFSTAVTKERMAEDIFDIKATSELTSDEILANAIKTKDREFILNLITDGSDIDKTWRFSMYPDEFVRRTLFDYNESLQKYYALDSKGLTSEKILAGPLSLNKKSLSEARIKFKEMLRNSDDVQAEDIKGSLLQKIALCGKYTVRVRECSKALESIIESMSPKMVSTGEYKTFANFEISRVDLFEKVVFDDLKFHEGAKKAAFKILNHVKSGGVVKANLYDDLLSSFKEVGLSNEVATQYSWDFLGLFSTLGAEAGKNIAVLTKNAANELAYSVTIIGSGMQVLDARMLGTGRLYTMPKNVITNIDNGKPYHFWMSAFLARELVQKGFSKPAAKYAVWLSQLGYQMKSETFGRNPLMAFTIDSFDSHNNKIRMDLVTSAAGNSFGLRSAKIVDSTVYNVDEGLKNLLNKGGRQKAIDIDEARELYQQGVGYNAFTRWMKIFSPDNALNYFD